MPFFCKLPKWFVVPAPNPPFFLTFLLSPLSFLQGAALGTLVEVQLSNNGMDDEAIVALFKSMALNPDLEVLNL